MSSKQRKRRSGGRGRGDGCADGCEAGCDVLDIFSLHNLVALTSGYVALQGADLGTGGSRLSRLLRRGVRAYQTRISADRPACCRMTPTCSGYSLVAIEEHGALRGSVLSVRRIRRCRPGGPTGEDPVPGR